MKDDRLSQPIVTLFILLTFFMTSAVAESRRSQLSITELAGKAQAAGYSLSLPTFETEPEQIQKAVETIIKESDSRLDQIGKLKATDVTFKNTVQTLDDIAYDADLVASRVYLIKETSEDAALRDKATEMIKVFQDWAVGLDYREDVYLAVKHLAETDPHLEGEDQKLLKETLLDYQRAGLGLAKEARAEVETLRKELASLSTDFDSNITNAEAELIFTADELQGVPESFLERPGLKNEAGDYVIKAHVTWHFVTIMENAKSETTRKRLKTARYSLAGSENVELLQKIVNLRTTIATLLGYGSWADYKTETRMAGKGQTALSFLKDLKEGLEPKFQQEIESYRQLKIAETGDSEATIQVWDWRYYSNQLKKQKYQVDTEQLRVYFPYEAALNGMFENFERIFSLQIRSIEPPYKWVSDLELYVVLDKQSEAPLGYFYLDMFPREGKFNHFAQFGIIPGKRLSNSSYQRPVVALICNFPKATKDTPALLSHNEVETLFHEFGHAMHSILTEANYVRFSGTSVPRDFVEAPSQMLEAWVWDKKVLDGFAADYRDPSKKIPASILDRMEEARLATIATFYRRQLSFGILDLTLHTASKDNPPNVVEDSNVILEEVFLPIPKPSTFVTYFGHLTGYDAGYYGYAWADAIAADLSTVFEESPQSFFDETIGMRLRKEIYAPGGSREAEVSINRFLQRERSIKPFLKSVGIEDSD